MAGFNSRDLRGWAVKGAEGRLLEMAAEAAAIYKAFPELRERGESLEARSAGGRAPTPRGKAARPAAKRREMSAEARERIAAAQRKRWAALRATRASGGDENGGATKTSRGRSEKKR